MNFAMVREDGSVASTLTAADPALVKMNTPAGCEPVSFEGDVRPGAHVLDRSTGQFVPTA